MGQGNGTGRTVYVGNLPATASVDELLNLVHFGPIESIRVLPEKSCVFLSFLDASTAASFHADAVIKKLSLHGQELKIGWGKNSGPLPPALALAVHSGATRNVYVGNVEDFDVFTEEKLKRDFGEYGEIELVNFLKEKCVDPPDILMRFC